MKCIDALSKEELYGKRVIVRAGLDLPTDSNGEVTEVFRVTQSLPTLRYLSERGAKVIILSHIGRDPHETNAPVARALGRHMSKLVYIADLCGTAAQSAISIMKPGDVLLLENIRQQYDLEKENDEGLAGELASLGDIYVNDAFSNSHRTHASMVALPGRLPHYAGLLVRDEVMNLQKALKPESPSFAILGGAKFETKSPLIRQLLVSYDHVFVAGALANDVLKAQGFEVGKSLLSKELPDAEVLSNPRFVTPLDVTVQRPDGSVRVKNPSEIAHDDRIVDIGPDTLARIAPLVAEAKFILWNGPTGIYEEGFEHWTQVLVELIAQSGAQKIIGGGDTLAVIEKSGVSSEKLGFLSTGGGAMLEYLLDGTLPALDALK